MKNKIDGLGLRHAAQHRANRRRWSGRVINPTQNLEPITSRMRNEWYINHSPSSLLSNVRLNIYAKMNTSKKTQAFPMGCVHSNPVGPPKRQNKQIIEHK